MLLTFVQGGAERSILPLGLHIILERVLDPLAARR